RARIKNRVWIPGVAHRIGKQTPDSQLIIGRPADIGDRSGVPVIVVWPRIVGVETAGAHGIIEAVDCAIALRPFTKRVVRPALGSEHDAWSSCALLCEDLDYSCKSAWAVQGTLRPAHHLDPVDVVGGEIGEIHQASQTLIDGNTVEQNLRMFATQPSHENRCQ